MGAGGQWNRAEQSPSPSTITGPSLGERGRTREGLSPATHSCPSVEFEPGGTLAQAGS